MKDVEVRIGSAAVRWETLVQSGRSFLPFPCRSRESSPSPRMASPSPSPTEAINFSTSDSARLNIPEIRIIVVGPEDSKTHHMQEFYPTPSPISPHPGTQSEEALIDRLDAVSSRMVWFNLALIPCLASGTGFCR